MVKNGQVEELRIPWLPARRGDDVEVLRLSALAPRVPRGVVERLEFHLLVLYTRGATHHEVDFERHAARPGALVYVAPGQAHRFALGRRTEGLALLFTPTIFAPSRRGGELSWRHGFFEDLAWPTVIRLGRAERRRLASALERVRDLARGHATPLRRALLQHAVAAALLEVALGAGLAPAAPTTRDDARRAGDFRAAVERSFRVTRRVLDYAERLACSARTLDRAARAAFGVSAKSYIDARVLLEAKRMLAHTDDSAASIALELGFDEPSNFAKFFRARARQSPGAFRAERRSR